jgi:hypothetical protein
MRPTASSKRDRHEMRLIKKHRRDRHVEKAVSSRPSCESDEDENVPKNKKRKRNDVCAEEEPVITLKKKKKKKNKLVEKVERKERKQRSSKVVAKVAAKIAVEESNRSSTRLRQNSPQAWSVAEDTTILKAILEAGERNVNWAKLLSLINASRACDRTMASVRGHWNNVMRANVVCNARSSTSAATSAAANAKVKVPKIKVDYIDTDEEQTAAGPSQLGRDKKAKCRKVKRNAVMVPKAEEESD